MARIQKSVQLPPRIAEQIEAISKQYGKSFHSIQVDLARLLVAKPLEVLQMIHQLDEPKEVKQ